MKRLLVYVLGSLSILTLVHEVALGMLIERGVAGALLAGRADPMTLTAALATLVLRMTVPFLGASLPTAVLWILTRHRA